MPPRRALPILALALAVGCDGGPSPDDDGGPPPFSRGPDRAAHCPPRDDVGCALDIGGHVPDRRVGATDGLDAEDGYADSRCGIGGGIGVEDAAFLFTAPAAGTYRFTTEGSGFDTILSVRSGTCAARELTCNDDARDGVAWSSVTLTLDECETVTLVVDGADGAGIGPYVLALDTSEASCMDGLDDDGDGLVDCDDPDCFGPRCDIDAGEWPDPWSALEVELYDAVNAQRARGAICDGEEMPPVRPLTRDVLLEAAARGHSLDMAERGYFDHDDPEGNGPEVRAAAVGYEAPAVGENISQGAETVDQAMAGWMASPGHCRNIMDGRWRAIGVGFASPDGALPHWTQVFGVR